jgi:elongation of very long chain fatty acids protein 4
MYSYYTLALLGVPTPWKKWITTCQMIQFAVCLSHSVFVYYMDTMPVVLSYAQAFVMVNMLYLFGNFYKKSYSSGAAGKKKA